MFTGELSLGHEGQGHKGAENEGIGRARCILAQERSSLGILVPCRAGNRTTL